MRPWTITGPDGVAGDGGKQGQGEGDVEKFAHGKTVSGRVLDRDISRIFGPKVQENSVLERFFA